MPILADAIAGYEETYNATHFVIAGHMCVTQCKLQFLFGVFCILLLCLSIFLGGIWCTRILLLQQHLILKCDHPGRFFAFCLRCHLHETLGLSLG